MEDRGIGIVGVVCDSAPWKKKFLVGDLKWHLIGKRAVCALSDINTVLSAASRHPLVNQRISKGVQPQIIIERNTTDRKNQPS